MNDRLLHRGRASPCSATLHGRHAPQRRARAALPDRVAAGRGGGLLRCSARRSSPPWRSSSTPAPSWCCSSSSIMMLNLGPATAAGRSARWLPPALVGPGAAGPVLLGELVYVLAQSRGGRPGAPAVGAEAGRRMALFGPYLLGVELASSCCWPGWSAPTTWRGASAAPARGGGGVMATVPIEYGLVLAAALFAARAGGRAGAAQHASSCCCRSRSCSTRAGPGLRRGRRALGSSRTGR